MDIVDFISIVKLPRYRKEEDEAACQMFYLAGTSNSTEKLAQLAFQKAYALGFKYIEATDMMDNFQILANDKFGFQ